MQAKGFDVSVYARKPEVLETMKTQYGIEKCYSTIKEAVADAEVVFVMVGYPKDVEEVFLGDDGIFANVKPGTYLVDMTTSSPSLAVRLYELGKEKGYGPLTICGQPHANPAIVTDAAALCLDEVKKNAPSTCPNTLVPMFNSYISAYAGGSDQFILDDPTVNIPTPMLGQWPDIAYHTAADTVECVDPDMLHKSASIGACYAYLLSNLEAADAPQILAKTLERCAKDIGDIVSETLEGKTGLDETFARLEDYEAFYVRTCADMRTYFTPEVYESQVKTVVDQYQDTISHMFDQAGKTLLCAVKAEGYTSVNQLDK